MKGNLGRKPADTAEKMPLVEHVSQDNAEQLDNSRKVKIRFGGQGIRSLSLLQAENVFEGADRTFSRNSFGVEIIPLRRSAQDTGIEAEVTVRVDINTAAIDRGCARALTSTAQRAAGRRFMGDGLRTYKFQAF